MRVFSQALLERKWSIRLEVVPVSDFRQSGEALESSKVQLALVQPDIFYPANGGTVALLRQEPVVLVVRSAEKEQGLSQLVGKNIIVLTDRPSDLDVVRHILSHYEITPPVTSIRSANPEELERGKATSAIDAMALIATPGTEYAQRLMQIVARVFGENAFDSTAGGSGDSRS